MNPYYVQDTYLHQESSYIFTHYLLYSITLIKSLLQSFKKGFIIPIGFPSVRDSKESACSAGDMDLIPGWGRSPGEGNGYPLQYSCLENPMNRGPWGSKESDTLEQKKHTFPLLLKKKKKSQSQAQRMPVNFPDTTLLIIDKIEK